MEENIMESGSEIERIKTILSNLVVYQNVTNNIIHISTNLSDNVSMMTNSLNAFEYLQSDIIVRIHKLLAVIGSDLFTVKGLLLELTENLNDALMEEGENFFYEMSNKIIEETKNAEKQANKNPLGIQVVGGNDILKNVVDFINSEVSKAKEGESDEEKDSRESTADTGSSTAPTKKPTRRSAKPAARSKKKKNEGGNTEGKGGETAKDI